MRIIRHRFLPSVLAAIAFFTCRLVAQQKPIPYGANPEAGHYLQVSDARVYYETYGSGGTPLVLLHGGLYGYIDEFSELIDAMRSHRRVIAIATRGHGRSEIGTQVFSYALFARDALAVIQHETNGKVDVVGFSDGAITSYLLAGEHPELVRKLAAIGGPRGEKDWTEKAVKELKQSQPSDVEKDSPAFVAERKKLMPAPERWEEFVTRVTKLEDGLEHVSDQQIQAIQEPALILAGDRGHRHSGTNPDRYRSECGDTTTSLGPRTSIARRPNTLQWCGIFTARPVLQRSSQDQR